METETTRDLKDKIWDTSNVLHNDTIGTDGQIYQILKNQRAIMQALIEIVEKQNEPTEGYA